MGDRISSPEPKNKGNNISIVSAICSTGVLAAMFCVCTFNGSAFECFIENHLLPYLRSGQILIMDNVSFHKCPLIIKKLKDIGVSVVFLPPYSPEFNPIENMWSKIKTFLRRQKIRTLKSFELYLKQALESVTEDDCDGWFSHCGYIT